MNKPLLMPASKDGWIEWLEEIQPGPFTLKDAKRLAVQCFAAYRAAPGPPAAAVRQAVSEAIKTHPRTWCCRGVYRINAKAN